MAADAPSYWWTKNKNQAEQKDHKWEKESLPNVPR